jgi:addiction module RelB/DinJ family antitoxin
MAAVQLATRVDENIRDEANAVVSKLGLDLPTVMKILVTQIATFRRIPLRIDMPIPNLDGDSFATDSEYFAQIPGYIESLTEADNDKDADLISIEELGWHNEKR